MIGIDGNCTAVIQKKRTVHNAIGEHDSTWMNIQTLTGWLDMTGGSSSDAGYSAYDAKIQQSTHVFVCDHQPLDGGVNAEDCRMLIDGLPYDLMLVDDPMGMHLQLEFYLRFTGGISRG